MNKKLLSTLFVVFSVMLLPTAFAEGVCPQSVHDLAASCPGGTLTSDTTSGSCRSLICEDGSGVDLSVLACDKLGTPADFFEMYQLSSGSSGVQSCLGVTCLNPSISGFVRSDNFEYLCEDDVVDPVCGNDVVEGDEECDGSAPDGFTCTDACELEELIDDEPKDDLCFLSVTEAPVSCDGTVTSDTVSPACRTVSCELNEDSFTVLACNKPDFETPTFFEMYKIASIGNPNFELCFGTTCMNPTITGFVRSEEFDICDQPSSVCGNEVIEDAEECDGSAPEGFICNEFCEIEEIDEPTCEILSVQDMVASCPTCFVDEDPVGFDSSDVFTVTEFTNLDDEDCVRLRMEEVRFELDSYLEAEACDDGQHPGMFMFTITDMPIPSLFSQANTPLPDNMQLCLNDVCVSEQDYGRGNKWAPHEMRFPFCGFDAVCGNGIVEDGEQCDDGNLKNGDTCSAQCRYDLSAVFVENVFLKDLGIDSPAHTFDIEENGIAVIDPTRLEDFLVQLDIEPLFQDADIPDGRDPSDLLFSAKLYFTSELSSDDSSVTIVTLTQQKFRLDASFFGSHVIEGPARLEYWLGDGIHKREFEFRYEEGSDSCEDLTIAEFPVSCTILGEDADIVSDTMMGDWKREVRCELDDKFADFDVFKKSQSVSEITVDISLPWTDRNTQAEFCIGNACMNSAVTSYLNTVISCEV